MGEGTMDAVRMIEQYEADHAKDDYTSDLEVYLNCIWEDSVKMPKKESRDSADIGDLLFERAGVLTGKV
jgi:hypothetical protein